MRVRGEEGYHGEYFRSEIVSDGSVNEWAAVGEALFEATELGLRIFFNSPGGKRKGLLATSESSS